MLSASLRRHLTFVHKHLKNFKIWFNLNHVSEDYSIMSKYFPESSSIFKHEEILWVWYRENYLSQWNWIKKARKRGLSFPLNFNWKSCTWGNHRDNILCVNYIQARQSFIIAYISCEFIPTTSCPAERLCSLARWEPTFLLNSMFFQCFLKLLCFSNLIVY